MIDNLYCVIQQAIQAGYSIIPVGEDKRPLLGSWKPYQFTSATSEQIQAWLAFNPAAWANVTGAVSRLIVLDFDGKVGNNTMRRLGLHPHVQTGSGGHHVYFHHPGWSVPTVSGKAKRRLGER